MTFFINFGKKARVYYTLSISRGGGAQAPGPPPWIRHCNGCLCFPQRQWFGSNSIIKKTDKYITSAILLKLGFISDMCLHHKCNTHVFSINLYCDKVTLI